LLEWIFLQNFLTNANLVTSFEWLKPNTQLFHDHLNTFSPTLARNPMKTSSTLFRLLALASSSLLVISSASAADLFWSADGTSQGGAGTWDTSNELWGSIEAGPYDTIWDNTANSNDTAVFGSTAGAVTLSNPINAGGIAFSTNGYSITGSTLTLAGAAAPVLNVSTGTSTISSDVAGTNGLEKTGGGTLILSGTNNTYSGTTTITAGTLQGNKSTPGGGSPFGTSTIQLNAGTLSTLTISTNDTSETFTFGNDVTVGGNVTISYGRIGGVGSNKTHAYGNLSIGNSTLSLTAGNIGHTVSFTGANLTGNAVFQGLLSTATANIGAITETGGPRSITKSGSNLLRLLGVNSYTGDTTINGGTLQIGSNNGALLGGIGGNYAGNIAITSGTLSIASNVNQTLSGIISGAGNLIKENSGTLFLGNSNTYTGKTTISPTTSTDATISIASFNSVVGGTSSSSLGAPTTVANGTIDLGNVAAGRRAAIIYTGAGETTDRVINFRFNNNGSVHTVSNTGAGLLKFTSAATGSGDAQNRGAVTLAGDGNGEFSQGLPFNFSNLTKSGNGTWTLGGSVGSGFSSAAVLTVNAGTLALQKKTSLHNGDTTRWTAAKINVKSGATLALNVDSGDVDGLSATSLDTLLTAIYGGTSTSQGLQAGAILGLDTSTATGGSFTQGNAITNSTGTGGGSLGLTKLGTGTLVFDKTNTYTGTTHIAGGSLKLGANDVLPNGSAVSLGTATLDADTRTDTAGTLNVTGSAVINLGSGAALTFADSSAGGTGEWVGTLNLVGFVSGSSLNFGSSTGLTAAQLSKISATGYSNFSLDAEGDLIADFGSGPGPIDKFAITTISSPQTVGSPITGITITAQDASNQTVTSFTGNVTFGGTGGFSGTSANFVAGVLTGVSVTPSNAGSNLTFTVTDGVSGKTGSTTITTIQTQYQAWALGGAFDADANSDGVSNGLAFLLGASGPSVSALNLLPTAAEDDGDLTLTFTMLPSSSRGAASLAIEYSNSLANGSWTSVNVPDSSGTVDDIVFTITGTNPLNVTARIPASKAAGNKLFGRIKGTNP
jgi:autotransporter-associated beta strand protein